MCQQQINEETSRREKSPRCNEVNNFRLQDNSKLKFAFTKHLFHCVLFICPRVLSLDPGKYVDKYIHRFFYSTSTHKKKLHSANRNWLCDPKNQQISQISARTKYFLHKFKKLVRVKVIKMPYGSQLKISLVPLLRDNLNRNYLPAFCCAQNKTHPEVLSISYMSTGSSIPVSEI